MPKILHFSDADIGVVSYGRRDPQSGLPVRIGDYLKSLDTIIDTAITEKVSLVLFTGNAYHHPTPSLVLQREWGRRVMRLSKAAIPTLLLVGSRDLASSLHRAHTLEAFDTLDVPHVYVVDVPTFFGADGTNKPEQAKFILLEDVGLQVIALPWLPPSVRSASRGTTMGEMGGTPALFQQIQDWLDHADPAIPVILAAHALVEAEKPQLYAQNGLVLPLSLVLDPRLDYVALGHERNARQLNPQGHPQGHPPVVYPGSIERSDFSEAGQDKFFILAEVERGTTKVEWRKLDKVRPLYNCVVKLEPAQILSSTAEITALIEKALPSASELKDAVVRLVLEYPREWETWVDEVALRKYTADTFTFHLVKRPYRNSALQVPAAQSIGSLSTMDLLNVYWHSDQLPDEEREDLLRLAGSVIEESDN